MMSLLLFFLPIINGLIGGFVGGYKVGTPGRAVLAAFLPALVVGLGMWLLLIILEVPIIGLIAGVALGTLVLLADVGIFIGALLGGALSNTKRLE